MKQTRRGYWIVVRALMLLWLALQAGAVIAAVPNAYVTSQSASGQSIEFTDIDIVHSDQMTMPNAGWRRMKTAIIWNPKELNERPGDYHAVWGRVRFDRATIGDAPLAIYTQDNREQILIFVNGVEIFRNFGAQDDIFQSWYRPYLIPLPATALRGGVNEIAVRVGSDYTVGIGKIIVGAQGPLADHYSWQHAGRITGPIIANAAMLVLGFAALLMWFVRRKEAELLFLALSSAFWFAANYHFYCEHTPISAALFQQVTLYSRYFAVAAGSGFCLSFLNIPRHRLIITAMFGLGLILSALHLFLGAPDLIVYLPTLMLAIVTALLCLVDLRRAWSIEAVVLSLVSALSTAVSVHDLGRHSGINWWIGAGFYAQPYIAFVFTLTFLLFFGRRALAAFSELGHANETLELGIAKARDELAASETQRRALEVDRALVGERERLMREMHDGIGSNLVTALAIAERQHQPAATIKTLKRAISDLKITVDSLEPVQGDLVALIGNLRHRMRLDLRAAGLTSKWEVGDCGPLPWLDATNALHVLRIFQEAISNVIAHSGATIMRIGCLDETRSNVPGIMVYVADNGRGFDTESADYGGGKGLDNMRSRAHAMRGQFTISSALGEGMKLVAWFPYDRNAVDLAAAKAPR